MKKRIIALLLSLVMLTSLLTPTALATEGQEPGTAQEETVKSNENEQTDQPGETENGDAKDENQAPQQPTTGDEEQPTGQDEPKNEDETKGEDGRPGEEPKQPEQPGDEQPTEPEQGEEPETPEEPEETEEPEFDAEAVYAQLMACGTVEEMDAIAAELTEEQIAQFSDDQLAAIEALYAELKGEEPAEEPEEDVVDNGIVDFTDVAPFLEPVQGETTRNILMAAVMGVVGTYSADTDRVDNGAVETSKTVSKTPDANGNYTITLESFVTGKTTTTEVTEEIPTDIILVLDQSGSMTETYSGATYKYEPVYNLSKSNTYYVGEGHTAVEWCNTCKKWTNGCYDKGFLWWEEHHSGTTYIPKTSANDTTSGRVQFYERVEIAAQTKLAALKAAVTTFANSVAEKAKGPDGTFGTDDDVNHRIAVVGFASGNYYNGRNYGYGNTEVFIGGNQYTYGTSAQNRYANAFQNMDSDDGVSNISASINALDANGGTLTNLGLEMANGIFEKNPIQQNQKRNRVVVVFTDGEPGWNGYDSSIARSAITQASTAKNTYGATVYTIGIFSGADATSAGNQNGSNTQKANWFMQTLSSNNGTPQTPSYYLTPGTAGSLEDVFKQISNQIETGGASIKLDATTEIRDVVSDYFDLPYGTDTSKIKVYTAKYAGTESEPDKWETRVEKTGLTVNISGKTVQVSGFDFAENYVGLDDDKGTKVAHGSKLIIEFPVQVRSGFLGGNGVPTNGEDSGIYNKEGTLIENYERPTMDVAIADVTVSAVDKNVYYGTALSDEQLKAGATIKCGNVDITNPDALADWQKEFVNITITANGNGFNGTEDKTYSIAASVAPDTTGDATAKSGSDEKKINVFTPVVTWQDSAIELGETANYEDNFVKVEWKHGTDEAKSEMGPAPTLVYEYDKAAAAFTQDTPVKVTVKLGTLDITSAVTFVHEDCTFKDCNFDAAKGQFIVHIKPFDLTITKTGRQGIDENQAFVFHVKSEDANVDMYVTIRFGSDSTTSNSVTIKDLKPGTYTITEESGWSWRYEVTDGASKTIKPENVGKTTPGQASVSFANSRTKNIYWLNGCSWAVNNWNNTEATKSPATPGKTN